MKRLGAVLLFLVAAFVSVNASAASYTGSISNDNGLRIGDTLISLNGKYRLLLQNDGNLVVSRIADNGLIWANYAYGTTVAIVQGDTNFVAYDDTVSPARAIWNTQTGKSPYTGGTLKLQDDGSLGLYNGQGTQVWSSPKDPQASSGGGTPPPSGGWSCAGAPIPDGYVLTNYLSSGCNGAGAWYQEPVRDGIWTCSGSPIVSGYAVTGYSNTGCSGIGAWYHQLARDGLWLCRGTPVPTGYHLTTTYDGAGCNGVGAWLSAKDVSGWSCGGAPIPDGYVLTNYLSTGCNGAGSWYHEPERDGIWTCSGSPMMSGYVRTDYISYGCNGIGAWYHQLARAGLWVCPYNPTPPGYLISASYYAPGCGGQGAWYLMKL